MQRRAAIEKPRPRSQAGFFAASNCHSKIGLRCLPLFVLHRGVITYPKPVAAPGRRDCPVDGRFIMLAFRAAARVASTARLRYASARQPLFAARAKAGGR